MDVPGDLSLSFSLSTRSTGEIPYSWLWPLPHEFLLLKALRAGFLAIPSDLVSFFLEAQNSNHEQNEGSLRRYSFVALQNLWLCHLMWQNGLCKWWNQDLQMERVLWVTWVGPIGSYVPLNVENFLCLWAEGGLTTEEQTDANRLALKMKESQWPLETGKERGRDSSLSLWEGIQPCWDLDFGQWHQWGLQQTQLRDNKRVLF